LIKLFAKKEGLNIVDIERIVSSPFEFQTHVMKNLCDRDKLEFPSVRVPNFGIFYCPDWKKEQFRKVNIKKELDNNEDN
jgi:hypothetical protein